MKKSYFIRLFIILLLCFLLALTAIAHPGKLDSSGGHYEATIKVYNLNILFILVVGILIIATAIKKIFKKH